MQQYNSGNIQAIHTLNLTSPAYLLVFFTADCSVEKDSVCFSQVVLVEPLFKRVRLVSQAERSSKTPNVKVFHMAKMAF